MNAVSIPRYRTERRPFDPSRYDSYLASYGSVYGDMSDPVKRAATVRALRRRDAMMSAAGRRELRRMVAEKNTEDLLHDVTVKRYQIEDCATVRPWNIRNFDIHWLRMVANELKRRGEI